jgi:hypothetical protein
MIDVDDLPDAIGIADPARVPLAPLAVGGHPLTPPRFREGSKTGWVHNQMPNCPLYLGYWVCGVCCRLGRDFRRDLCPYRSEVI